MFKIGDRVYQVTGTKTIKKGDIGEIIWPHARTAGAENYYEVMFPTLSGDVYRLRYESEIAALTPAMIAALSGTLPVGPAQAKTIGTPLYKIGDQVTCIKTSSSYWSQSGEVIQVDTAVTPWVYMVRFHTANSGTAHISFYEKDLIASTRPMPQQQSAAPKKSFGQIIGKHIDLNKTPVKSKGACCCGALHTSNPNCHAHWCDAS